MTVNELLAEIEHQEPPAAAADVAALEQSLGHSLPDDYRQFLIACNDGYVGGRLWFDGPTPDGEKADAGVRHIGGLRDESYFSLQWARDIYEGR